MISSSLRASSPFGGYREKYTRERHARGDATAPHGFAARSRVLARLASLAQIGELTRRLDFIVYENPQQPDKETMAQLSIVAIELFPHVSVKYMNPFNFGAETGVIL